MTDDNPPWFAPDHKPTGIPRQPTPGAEVWRLRHPDGRVHACELQDDSAVGAGWQVMMVADSELLYSRRCDTETQARYLARAWRLALKI